MATSSSSQPKKHYWLYVLKLNQGKYYVGTTALKDPQKRIQQHRLGYYSAQWVKKYGYKSTFDIVDIGYLNRDEVRKRENRYTLEYMKKYGKSNVRGGDFNYSGKYYSRFGYLVPDEWWRAITVIVLLLLIIAVLELRWLLRK